MAALWIGVSGYMIGGAAIGAHPPAGDPVQQPFEGHIDVDHIIDIGERLQSLSLCNGSGETVQEEAVFAILLGDTVLDHANDDGIGDKLPFIHVCLGLAAKGGSFADL